MLSPPVVRAGVARPRSASPIAPSRRSASTSRVAPLQLPALTPSIPHARKHSRSRSGAPTVPDIDEQQTPHRSPSSTAAKGDLQLPADDLMSPTSPSSLVDSPPSHSRLADPFNASMPSPLSAYDAPSPTTAAASSILSAAAADVPTAQHAWWLTMESPHHEAQFRSSLRSQTDAQLSPTLCVAMALLYGGAVASHVVGYGDDAMLMLQRLLLLLASLITTAVFVAWTKLYRRYETAEQALVLGIGVCASTLWILAFAVHAAALELTCNPAALILFNSIWLSGRPLLLPYAVAQLAFSSALFTAVACVNPSSDDTAVQLFFAALCVWLHAVVLTVYLRRLEAASRAHYCHSLSLGQLHATNQQLTSDTRQLKSDFFVLTLERFDIADVEEEGKVLSSAMEQAMGKLQALGKNQLLPPVVLKEIMAVISLLGSGSDLFKAKMEHTSLGGEDDEMTRYIYETLNGEHNRSSHTPTQRSLTYVPSKPGAVATDLSTITERATGAGGSIVGVGIEVASELDRSLSGLLTQLEDWNLDLFEVSTMTAGRPLYFIGMALLKRYNCLAEFDLDVVRLSNYLREMEAGYGTNNPYHNSIHAADVARSVHYFIECGRLTHYCTKLEIFTLIIASLAHDYQHPGKNNAYLISVRDERALIYNDRSVLENFHTAQTFHLLLNSNHHTHNNNNSNSNNNNNSMSNCNFLSHFSHKDYLTFRRLMVELVLATDLAHSNEFLGRFKNWYVNANGSTGNANNNNPTNGNTVATAAANTANPGFATALALALSGTSDGGISIAGSVGLSSASVPAASQCFQSTSVTQLDHEARVMVMKMALKCADIGHSAKRLQLHEKWTARITEEFYRQGDEERKQALPISPFMDRRKANLSQSQTGFIDYVCQPLYGAWFKFLDPDEKRQRDMHHARISALRDGGDRDRDRDREGSRGGGEGGGGGGAGESGGGAGTGFDWVRKRTASQMRLDEEMVSVLEQLKRNREHWKTWQGPTGSSSSPKT